MSKNEIHTLLLRYDNHTLTLTEIREAQEAREGGKLVFNLTSYSPI